MIEYKERGIYMKIALLSNVNMDAAIRLLKRDIDIYESEGYGNELGTLLNSMSSIYSFRPDIIFLIIDLMEIIHHDFQKDKIEEYIDDWFSQIETVINTSNIYYISDSYLWGSELNVIIDKSFKQSVEQLWQIRLESLLLKYNNVRIFPYHHLVECMGENNVFSLKMWYMGRIIHNITFQKVLCDEIIRIVDLETRTYKKVLLVDLDNTLWGGLAGENDITPIKLSNEHTGLAYKNLQRVIAQMKNQGVIIGIVSKNNESDVMPIIKNHPHMILHDDDFAIKKINWEQKNVNIEAIVSELNLSLDSVVFFDDSPAERQLIKELLPDVFVPEFPAHPEDLADTMVGIWKAYFERPSITMEDLNKTKQYIANAKRNEYEKQVDDFEKYLQGLDIKLTCVSEKNHVDRIVQLINKTNQFNLTTRRYSQNIIQEWLNDKKKRIYAFHESDRFGDNGIIAVVIVDLAEATPIITDFVMSCRVMGKNIEYAIIDFVENDISNEDCKTLYADYVKSAKNAPVEHLYDDLGYKRMTQSEEKRRYMLTFSEKKNREYVLTLLSERNENDDD